MSAAKKLVALVTGRCPVTLGDKRPGKRSIDRRKALSPNGLRKSAVPFSFRPAGKEESWDRAGASPKTGEGRSWPHPDHDHGYMVPDMVPAGTKLPPFVPPQAGDFTRFSLGACRKMPFFANPLGRTPCGKSVSRDRVYNWSKSPAPAYLFVARSRAQRAGSRVLSAEDEG